MKKLYVFILFLVFFNIIMFMFGAIDVFKMNYSADETEFGIDEDGNVIGSGQEVFENISGGFSPWDIVGLFFGNVENAGSFLLGIGIIGVSLAAAWITKSPAPFVVGFIINVMKNIYVNSLPVVENLPGISPWMMLAGMIGMVILFIITMAETLTHGEA